AEVESEALRRYRQRRQADEWEREGRGFDRLDHALSPAAAADSTAAANPGAAVTPRSTTTAPAAPTMIRCSAVSRRTRKRRVRLSICKVSSSARRRRLPAKAAMRPAP